MPGCGERVFVDCDVRQIFVELNSASGSARPRALRRANHDNES